MYTPVSTTAARGNAIRNAEQVSATTSSGMRDQEPLEAQRAGDRALLGDDSLAASAAM